MDVDELVDTEQLRAQVREKYREVATDPQRPFHFHTGRPLAARLRYDTAAVDALPDRAVESFAGVGNPFSLRQLEPGERVVDVGSGAGFDSFIAAGQVGTTGIVVGIDMTSEMLEKEREIYKAQALATGKPEAVVDKIVAGKMEKFYEENCLYEQHYIKDEGQTIGEMVNAAIAKLGENISIKRFARFKVGEEAKSAAAPDSTSGRCYWPSGRRCCWWRCFSTGMGR